MAEMTVNRSAISPEEKILSERQVLSFGKGRRGTLLSAFTTLTETLHVPVQDLLDAKTLGGIPRLQNQLERLQKQRRSHQELVRQILEAVLQQAER